MPVCTFPCSLEDGGICGGANQGGLEEEAGIGALLAVD